MRLKLRKPNRLAKALGLSLFACAASLGVLFKPAAASTVTIVELFPDTSTTFAGPIGPFTLDSADLPTLPDPFGISRPWTFDVTDSRIIFTPNESENYTGGVGFNGFEFIFSGGFPAITNVSSDASSTFNPVGISFTSDTVFLDYQGLSALVGLTSIVDITGSSNVSSVPEASTWAMMLLGFAAVGLMAYRQKSKQESIAAFKHRRIALSLVRSQVTDGVPEPWTWPIMLMGFIEAAL